MVKPSAMSPSIGVLLISTWKYNKFIDKTVSDIRKHFFPKNSVKIFLHTDSVSFHDVDVVIPVEHKPWPLITLLRFNLFSQNASVYDTDYLFYLDIDTKVLNCVTEDVLGDFVVTEHSGYKGRRGTPETNPLSTAFIGLDEEVTYVCGGFFGGLRSRFLEASEVMRNNIQKDLDNNIIAIWHDESHLNRYYVNHKDEIKLLSFEYMYNATNPNYVISNPIMMPYHNYEKGFNKFDNGITENMFYIFISHSSKLLEHYETISKIMLDLKHKDYGIFYGGQPVIKNDHIFHINCDDTYEGLPNKIYNICKYISCNSFFEKFSHFCKIDATTPIGSLVCVMPQDYYGCILTQDNDNAGRSFHFNKCSPNSEWNTKTYKGKFIPYCVGGGYVLSKKSINCIAQHSNDPNCDIYEDLYVAQQLNKCGIHPINYNIKQHLLNQSW